MKKWSKNNVVKKGYSQDLVKQNVVVPATHVDLVQFLFSFMSQLKVKVKIFCQTFKFVLFFLIFFQNWGMKFIFANFQVCVVLLLPYAFQHKKAWLILWFWSPSQFTWDHMKTNKSRGVLEKACARSFMHIAIIIYRKIRAVTNFWLYPR